MEQPPSKQLLERQRAFEEMLSRYRGDPARICWPNERRIAVIEEVDVARERVNAVCNRVALYEPMRTHEMHRLKNKLLEETLAFERFVQKERRVHEQSGADSGRVANADNVQDGEVAVDVVQIEADGYEEWAEQMENLSPTELAAGGVPTNRPPRSEVVVPKGYRAIDWSAQEPTALPINRAPLCARQPWSSQRADDSHSEDTPFVSSAVSPTGSHRAVGNRLLVLPISQPYQERANRVLPVQPYGGRLCFVCKAVDHWPHRCPGLLIMCLQARRAVINARGACNNCLRTGHITEKCPQPGCHRCQGALHNSILCRESPNNY